MHLVTETLKVFCHEMARLNLVPNLIPMLSGTAFKHYIPLIFLAPAVLECNWEKKLMLFSMMDFNTCRLACFAYLT